MDLDTYIVAVYCTLEDGLQGVVQSQGRWRTRGPAPVLTDAEVLTLEVVGEYLGLDEDQAIYRYFRQHYGTWFPALTRVARTTFTRQAANLWAVKQAVWRWLLDRVPHDPTLSLIDCAPVPVCRFGRAPRCRRFRGQAAFGYDTGSRTAFYGLRCHLRVCWPGVVTAISRAPANVAEPDLVPELTTATTGLLLGDRNYWHPRLRDDLASTGVALLAPFRKRSRDPDPVGSRRITRLRWRIETVFSQFVERYHLKRVRARDPWHLTVRIARKVLSHTLGVFLAPDPHRPLTFACLTVEPA